jgi:hypothetical protein
MLLYRFLGDSRALEIAQDTIRDLAESQWPDGTFGDQGGGAGIHGRAAFIVKPWMGWLATVGVLDYLAHFPDDALALGILEKFINWSMQVIGPKAGGEKFGWTYQYPFRAHPMPGLESQPYPGPELHLFHFDYLARLMTFWSLRTGDPKYFEAFARSYEGIGIKRHRGYWDCPAALYYLPWLSAKLWDATPAGESIATRPVYLGPRTPRQATVLTPQGPVEVGWTPKAKPTVPSGVKIKRRGVGGVR